MKITATSTTLAALLLGLAHRTSAQDDCTQCDDVPTPKMEKKGKTCADAQNKIQNNCNGSDNWIKKKFCRYTCSVNGLGYEDEDPCCADGPSDGEQAATAAPTAAGTTAVTDSGTEGATTEATGSKETLEPTATATGTTDEPTATATGPKFTDEPTATATGTGTEPTAAPVEAVTLPEVEQDPLESAPANLGDLCSSESLQTETGIASCAEACAPAQCCQTDLDSANCGFLECASYGECIALASLIGVDVPVTLPEVEEEKEGSFDKLACPDGYTLDTFLPQLNGDNCIVCVAPAVSRDNATGTIMVAQEECVATCGLETCDFVPADCGVVVCPEVSPTAAPTVMETAAPTGAPTEGAEPTDAPSVIGPTSPAAGGRTSSVMAVTAVVAAATLLWA